MRDGLVLRYTEDAGRSVVGHAPRRGTFSSFLYADNLALSGKLDDAQAMFERLLTLDNDVGLFAEKLRADRPHASTNFHRR
ncbi:MAG: hypothetical protein R3F24_09300 [Gammaproteobacteria bacterium]